MFFALPWPAGGYPPAGIFSISHLIMLIVTVVLIVLGLYLSRDMSEQKVRRVVRMVTALLWVLEIIKICFVLFVTKSRNPNEFIPLYYCSLILYAGLFSSFGKRFFRQLGDCFIATGGIVGGAVFLLFPTTSLPRYPVFHFLSLHSFLLHGLMVYLGLLLLMRRIYRPQRKDIKYCALLISVMCALAFLFNTVYDRVNSVALANLMFISKDFPGTPVSIIYRLCGPFFTPVMWLIQAFGPYLLVYWVYLLVCHLRKKKHRDEI